MATSKEILLPDIGDFDQVEVIEVLVSAGSQIKAEDSLITLESDKATMEIPSPDAGTVKEVLVNVGDKVAQGHPIVRLDLAVTDAVPAAPQTDALPAQAAPAAPLPAPAPESAASGPLPGAPLPVPPPVPPMSPSELLATRAGKAHASPSVRRFARELGVAIGEVKGTGNKGRILRGDVQAFIKAAMTLKAGRAGAGPAIPEMPEIDFSQYGEIEVRPLSRIQKLSGANLHRNWVTIPHVTQFDEADITELDAFRKAQKESLAKEDVKLTLLSFLMKAAVVALKQFPEFNASLAPGGEEVIYKKYYHIGIAVDTPDGLVVPVVRNVEQKGLFQLAAELSEISEKARNRKLKTDEMRGGTFSISSLGGLGGTAFTPIVNAPEVAILGISRASMQPVYKDGAFVPRLILPLSLSYDHRVIDGAAAARFTTTVRKVLSDIRHMLL